MDKMLDSVLNQTYKNYKMIFIDDGSTDKGINKITYALSDSKFIDLKYIIIKKENGGVSSARNEGIRLAKCKYLYFLDSDNYIEKDLCETIYNTQIKYDSDFILFGYDIIKNGIISGWWNMDNEKFLDSQDVLRVFIFLKQLIY